MTGYIGEWYFDSVITDVDAEPDPLEEALAAAGIGRAPTPRHWQAIERTNDFEAQQKATRQALAALSDEMGELGSEAGMAYASDPERPVPRPVGIWSSGGNISPAGHIVQLRAVYLNPDPAALVHSVDLTGFVARIAMSLDVDPGILGFPGDHDGCLCNVREPPPPPPPTSMRQAVARRRKAERTRSRDRARDAIARGRRNR